MVNRTAVFLLRFTLLGAALALLFLAVAFPLKPWIQAGLLLLDAVDSQQRAEWLHRWNDRSVRTEAVQMGTRYGPIFGRFYLPSGPVGTPVVLVHGMHAAGIAEERLGPFARKLAARGIPVLTPEMEELRHYLITPQTTDKIEDAVSWLAGQNRFARSGRVGLIGISFSGGLSVVAAGRTGIRDKVSFVVSIGGHGEIHRAMRYLCTGQLPEGRGYARPHDYGVGILLLNLADRLVPATQTRPLTEGITAYLHEDEEQGRARMQELGEPAAQILKWVDGRDFDHVGPLMLPWLEPLASDPALSPERSAPPAASVFLIHGAADRLIPAFETEALARYLRGKTEVHWLITPLISHVELERSPALGDIWKLLRFWERIVRASGR